jgi:hypothetical protein
VAWWYVTNRDLLTAINALTAKADKILMSQAELDAAAAQIQADVTAEATALAQLKTMIAGATNLASLQAAVAALDAETAAESTAAGT